MELFFLPFQVFLVFPPLAIVLGLAFRAVHRGRTAGRGAAGTAAFLWIVYGVYECYMSWIWSPAHIAPIRADLFLFAPVLYLVSFLAIFTGSTDNDKLPPALHGPQVEVQKECAAALPGIEVVENETSISAITCSGCNYTRQAADDAPQWQCPNCQKAYVKTARVVQRQE